MSKRSREEWQKRNGDGQQNAQSAVDQTEADTAPINPDAARVDQPEEPPIVDPDGIQPGQVYDGVVVPDRKINIIGLRPGSILPAIMTEAPYGDGRWMCSFVGERGTKINADAEMLRTGKMRSDAKGGGQ
jgi:hypothetical protein